MIICPECDEIISDVCLNGIAGEILDLIAEAARSSAHAARAYDLLLSENGEIGPLAGRQRLIGDRMGIYAR